MAHCLLSTGSKHNLREPHLAASTGNNCLLDRVKNKAASHCRLAELMILERSKDVSMYSTLLEMTKMSMFYCVVKALSGDRRGVCNGGHGA